MLLEKPIEKTKQELSRRRYSKKTIDAYCLCLKKFFGWVKKDARSVTKKDIEEFLFYLDNNRKASSTMNLHISAIKFYLQDVLNRNINIKIRYSKRRKRVPDFLDYCELGSLIKAIENKKHRLLVEVMYSSGMRVSEVVKVKVKDVFERCILVRGGKGNKDRFVAFAQVLRRRVFDHVKENELGFDDYLFQGRKGHLTTRSVQAILKHASRKAKIKRVHPHMLRHSYGTHAIMQGIDVVRLQSSMGHKRIDTTLGYTHGRFKVKSPYDTQNDNISQQSL